MRFHISSIALITSLFVTGGSAALPPAQVAAVTESPLRAVGADAARRQQNPPDAATSYYATVLPSQAGEMGLDHVDPVPGYQFVAVKLVLSVAPSIYAGAQDISGGQTTRALGALRHLSAHVTVRGLDGDGRPMDIKRDGHVVLSTLEISPSEPSFAERATNRQSVTATAVTETVPLIKPVSGVIQAFQSALHRTPNATQVAFMTGPSAFGWRWYESPGATIEGLHHAAALLQVGDTIKTVRITVELVADWRAFGVWARSFDFDYPLPRAPG